MFSFVVVLCCAIVFAVVVAIVRMRLKIKSKGLLVQLNKLGSYSYKCCLSELEYVKNVDIPADFNRVFNGKIASARQLSDFINHYSHCYETASSLLKRMNRFRVDCPIEVLKYIEEFELIGEFAKTHNKKVINGLLETHSSFFDTCLKYPLDKQQRRSIVSEEDNCLVVSSAGSGKTSSIVGKVKYLTEIKGILPKRILLISYTNKAAAELTERIDTKGLKGYTFHKLAIDIIGSVTKEKPSICDNTDALFIDIYHQLLETAFFKKHVVEYFADYQNTEAFWERRKNERREMLSEQKDVRIKALLPDMDGKTINVRSEQEQKICFALSSLGVNFRYEEPYEHQLANEMYSQYCPDFSIHYNYNGKHKRIYLEHFGIDEHGLVPSWFAKDKNITHEEANKLYNDGITWKKTAHEKFGTKLIVTSSADFQYNDIKEKLKQLLNDVGVPIEEKTEEELYELVLPKGSKQEKAFIRLIVTFATLVKSSCKSISEILRLAKTAGDERSEFIIKNIFQPVYDCYIEELRRRKQIDFTDAILQATEICRNSRPVEYDYIIVDEFQDISIDRYQFLKVLREGAVPAKLYCVGDDWQSIYRFSGSDMALFNQFPDYFGPTEINKIETTYRFGEPLVSMSSKFIQRNNSQIKKTICSYNPNLKTEMEFCSYNRLEYCSLIKQIVSSIPSDKSVFLLGRYSFDDYYLSFMYKGAKEGDKFYYNIDGRKIEFITVHKSKGLEADYVILLQCNKDTYGFPSLVSDDPVLNYVLTNGDSFPFGEERRLFYVAMTRAKVKTFILYDKRFPSVFVDEFLRPERITEKSYNKHPNANKKWTRSEERFLLKLHNEGRNIKYIATKMGRSQTSIVMRLNKLKENN